MKKVVKAVSLLLAASVPCCPAAQSAGRGIVSAKNPDPDALPTLGVWQRGAEILVSASFPNVPGLICDSWCYESDFDFISAKETDRGAIELRHRVRQYPKLVVVTRVTPEPGAVEFKARIVEDAAAQGGLPPESWAPFVNLCCQLKRAAGFASASRPYPEFVKRCFIFTARGRTFLNDTVRKKIPSRPAKAAVNNPPWVQSYVGRWQQPPAVASNAWADFSSDRYTVTVIGAVSKDGKHLAAIANDTATVMCQAWHDCLHNNALWEPADVPLRERTWRVKIYALENDPDKLLEKAERDFPGIKQQRLRAEAP